MPRVPKLSSRLLLALIVVLTLVLSAESVVLAASAFPENGGAVTAVRTVTILSPASTSATSFVYVPDMSVTVKVPTQQRALFLITVSGPAACYGTPSAYCEVEVLVSGPPGTTFANPGPVVFTSSMLGGAPAAIGSQSMQFTISDVPAGTYTVQVAYKVNESGAEFDFGNRTLTVLRSRL